MSLRNRKAVFLDIDGTLITGGRGPFEDDKRAMEEAVQKGHLLFLNTGRSFANIPPEVLELSTLAGIAAGGGGHVLFDETLAASSPTASSAGAGSSRYRTVYHKWFSDDELAEVFALYERRPCCCIFEGEQNCYIINASPWASELKPPERVNSFKDFKRKSAGDLITKLTIEGIIPEDELRILEKFCQINLFPKYTEGVIKGENKATAIEIVLDRLGMERKDSIAIGDGINDLDMIRFAGLGIAMGNACAELKAAAGAITGECGKGGVAGALNMSLRLSQD